MTIQSGGKQLLLHGLSMILAGLVWGIFIPMTPFPRLALGAHIQYEVNGMLLILIALVLLKVPSNVGPKTIGLMIVSAWLTWFMLFTETANAWWGTNQVLPIAAQQAGATGAAPWQEIIVKLGHIPVSLVLILSIALLIVGIARHRNSDPS